MQIRRIQTGNRQVNTFKSFNITPQAKELANISPARNDIVNKAAHFFRCSDYVDFNILDNFIPQIIIKQTGEKLTGALNALKLDSNKALRIYNDNIKLDFILPENCTTECQETLINKSFNSNAEKSSYIAELLEKSGKEHHGRFLI